MPVNGVRGGWATLFEEIHPSGRRRVFGRVWWLSASSPMPDAMQITYNLLGTRRVPVTFERQTDDPNEKPCHLRNTIMWNDY